MIMIIPDFGAAVDAPPPSFRNRLSAARFIKLSRARCQAAK